MEEHLDQVVRALKRGRLVFFLGAGASLSDRKDGWTWDHKQREGLPSARELSNHLAQEFHVDPGEDLAKVAQQVEILVCPTERLPGSNHPTPTVK